MKAVKDLHRLLAKALEEARLEVCRRMNEKGYPLTVPYSQPVVVTNADGSGWRSDYREIHVSGLHDLSAMIAVSDRSGPFTSVAFGDQIQELAESLAETHLGQAREYGVYPQATGAEGVMARCLSPLVATYLRRLTDLNERDPELVRELAGELTAIITNEDVTHVRQLAIAGVRPKGELSHRGVLLRPLDEIERGAIVAHQNAAVATNIVVQSDFVVPTRLDIFMPSALLGVETKRARDHVDGSTLLERVLLALLVFGFKVGGSSVVEYERPKWAAQGFSIGGRIPLSERAGLDTEISQQALEAVVEFALRTPEFAGDESSRESIVLHRTLVGGGAQSSEAGFLDFMIALEGALLAGVQVELSFRFALYGALFLRDDRDPIETYAALRHMYKVRSRLVHGTPTRKTDRATASKDAEELAYAVVKKAVTTGWPSAEELERVALTVTGRELEAERSATTEGEQAD